MSGRVAPVPALPTGFLQAAHVSPPARSRPRGGAITYVDGDTVSAFDEGHLSDQLPV